MTPPPLEDLNGDTPVKLPLRQAIYILLSVIVFVASAVWAVGVIVGKFEQAEKDIKDLQHRVNVIEDLQDRGRK